MENTELVVDIANLAFTVGLVEEVGLAKVYNTEHLKNIPDAYTVSWSEWIKNHAGNTLKSKEEPQVYKVKKFQKFIDSDVQTAYEKARLFFLQKIDEISKSYKEEHHLK